MEKKNKKMILVGRDGLRLCKDGMLRRFAMFGTPTWTAKLYCSFNWAEKKAKEIGGYVIVVPDGMTIDSTGNFHEAS